ncbi:helix-turn-helix domain-containing protein [Motilimonas eburnea]|uniref:helix-turn-helix domain-containing protein n=1 Tax=Motilimonas eburnea TaxID=1737488 RepID=UPI001E2C734E|nr:AraC family transcriptional regulator [Motilimonas eburnea]MCE2570180.1 AraC family transcriptional regulator [Motilimonas eburnea]
MKPYMEKISGDLACPWRVARYQCAGAKFDWHYHLEYELILQRDSMGQLFVDDSIIPYGHNTLALIGPNLPHTSCISNLLNGAHHSDTFAVWFNPLWLNEVVKSIPEFKPIEKLFCHAQQGILFPQTLAQAVFERLCIHDELSPMRQVNNLIEILILMAECPQVENLTRGRHLTWQEDEVAQHKLAKVAHFIADQFHQDIRIQDICDLLHMSASSVQRMFDKHFNESFTVHLNQYRVGKACQQLINSKQGIAVIADQVGFNNLANFNRQFRQFKGMTPSAFRRRFATGGQDKPR